MLVAWLSIDAEDDEPVRFVYHLAQALRYACGNLGESAIGLTVAGSLAPAQSIISALINELAEVGDEVSNVTFPFFVAASSGLVFQRRCHVPSAHEHDLLRHRFGVSVQDVASGERPRFINP
ncbi:hypothetical protein [Paraburkholderia sp. EG287B]|uniref:hypothetical protein n=1 Tax=Paraburkholderia sp. EG287B TaxID=3237010 RepID=UPI0034D2AAED